MEEKYKAVPNNAQEEVSAEEKQAAQTQKNDNNNQAFLQNAASVAEHIPVAAVYAKAFKLADKVTGGKVSELGGKVLTKVGNTAPGGQIVQNSINKVQDSGIGDAAGKIASMKSDGAKSAAAETAREAKNNDALKDISSSSQSKDSNSKSIPENANSSDNDSSKKKKKPGKIIKKVIPLPFKLAILGGVVFLFFIIFFIVMVSDQLEDMLDLTSGPGSGTSFSASSKVPYTSEEIEQLLVYVGDSRIVGMQSAIANQSITYIAEVGAGYNYLTAEASEAFDTAFIDKRFAVMAFGVNDLSNVDKYISYYKELIEKYPDIEFYFMSVNPVDENNDTYSVKNSDIEAFNKKIYNNFNEKYIDIYSQIKTSFYAEDGLHYSAETNAQIHSLVVKYILGTASKNANSCGKEIVNYYQYNYSDSYGYGTTISSAGCGPTSMAMVASTLLDKTITPVETAKYSLENGYRVEGQGTAWAFFPAIAQHYGLNCQEVALSEENIINNLKDCKLLIISMSCCTFTSNGHFIVLTGIDADGKITVADPASEEKSKKSWDISILLSEGGKLWAFSN